ncbi:MAG: hypothetical protein P4L69_09925 [Desulfosporosinus sp.]|nr:hypothetical protein [Desulfosporosinus sp.]
MIEGPCEFVPHCPKFDEINIRFTILYCQNNHRDCARYQLAEWLVNKKSEGPPGIQGVPPNLQPNEYAVAAALKKLPFLMREQK